MKCTRLIQYDVFSLKVTDVILRRDDLLEITHQLVQADFNRAWRSGAIAEKYIPKPHYFGHRA